MPVYENNAFQGLKADLDRMQAFSDDDLGGTLHQELWAKRVCRKCGHGKFHTVDVDPSLAFATVACCQCGKTIRATEEEVEDGKIEIVRK